MGWQIGIIAVFNEILTSVCVYVLGRWLRSMIHWERKREKEGGKKGWTERKSWINHLAHEVWGAAKFIGQASRQDTQARFLLTVLRQNFFFFVKTQFLSLRPSTDWIKSTDFIEGNFLLIKSADSK